MNELIDIPMMWKKFTAFCKSNFWWSIFISISVSLMLGMAYQAKSITDDCKFMGVFREGSLAYECRVRIRG